MLMTLAYCILYPKDDESLIVIDEFYALEENSIDILFLGSSRNIMNINPAVIWMESNLSSFAFGATGQPLWNSYHYLVEGLKTQSPQLVVLEVGMISFEEEYSEYNFIVKNNLGLKQSKNRYESIQTSAPDDIRVDLLLKFPVFHDRYDELTINDFTLGLLDNDIDYRGFTASGAQVPYDVPIDNSADTTYTIPEKNLTYLNKIIELCNQQNIALMLLATPDIITEPSGWSEMCDSISQQVEQIAVKNNLDYVYCDGIAQDIGLDYSTDFRDERHLNLLGADKLSRYLAEYISDNYNIIASNNDVQELDDWSNAVYDSLYQ